jgi:hypothetical protein
VVKSWNSWDGTCYTGSASQSTSGNTADAAGPTDGAVVLLRPNLSDSGVQTLARNLTGALSQSAITADISMRGDTSLQPRDIVTIPGTGPGFNTPYSIKSIRRRFSPVDGFTQRVKAVAVGDSLPD